jgi:cytochrome c oxidase subunit 2
MAGHQESSDTRDPHKSSARRGWAAVAMLWALVTAAALAGANILRLPSGFGREADISDEAFRLLMYMAAPVFGAVVAVVVVAVVAFRAQSPSNSTKARDKQGAPVQKDGAHIVSVPKLDVGWLVVTTALAVVLIVNPGIVGLVRFFDTGAATDLVVQVEGARWFWTVTYPEQEVSTNKELVLPAHKRTRIEVSSRDILHSFWIPALRIKIDAVPGRTTVISTTPEREGGYDQDEGLRLQCAELCGLAHSTMAIPVRLVSDAEFARWVAEQNAATRQTMAQQVSCPPASATIEITAKNVSFDKQCLSIPAGSPVRIVMHNDEPIPHNLSVLEKKGGNAIFVGETVTGPTSVEYTVPPIPAGTYYFQCDLHPIPAMSGIFKVE